MFAAPGRVNLIGEHTDYAEGFVMPAAIDFATLAGISPRTDGKIVLYAENYSEERVFDAAALPAKAEKHWSDYPLGVLAILARRGAHDSGVQFDALGRCAAGVGTVEFGVGRSGDCAGGDFVAGRQLSGPEYLHAYASARRTSLWALIAESWTSSSRRMARRIMRCCLIAAI